MALHEGLCEALIDATGTGALSDVLLQTAYQIAGVEEVFAYWLDKTTAPCCIVSSGHHGSAQSRADRYIRSFHPLDPLGILAHYEGEGIQMARVLASDVQDSTYRRECFEHPGIGEKIAFARHRDGQNFVLNFYRCRDKSPVQIEALSELAQLALPLLRKHLHLMGDESGLPVLARLERRMHNAYPLMSKREIDVCARTLTGMTAEAIGLDLRISMATVLTYRRRAYERYGLSSVQGMVGRLLF